MESFIWKVILFTIGAAFIRVFFIDKLIEDDKKSQYVSVVLCTGLFSLGSAFVTEHFEWTYIVLGVLGLMLEAISGPEKIPNGYTDSADDTLITIDEIGDISPEEVPYYERYKKLRREIEQTTMYKNWRKDVLNKFGGKKKCSMCESTENIEIDHRFKSFYSIIKSNNVSNLIEAYECEELWDINNGAPLCREHHNQTQSNIRYRKLNDYH